MESMRSGGAIPPPKRGISAMLVRYHMKTRQMGAIPPSAKLSRKGIARYGWMSRTGPLRWADSRESILASEKEKKKHCLRIDLPKNGIAARTGRESREFNANRREDAIRANLAKCFKNRHCFANRFARICKTLVSMVCESSAHKGTKLPLQTQTLHTLKKCQGSISGRDGVNITQEILWQLILERITPNHCKRMLHESNL